MILDSGLLFFGPPCIYNLWCAQTSTPCIKHKLLESIYSNTETSLAMSTLAKWCRVVQSRGVSPHNFDGLAMSGFAFSALRLTHTN